MISYWTDSCTNRHLGRMLRPLAFLCALVGQPLQAAAISGIDMRSDTVVVRFDDIVKGASAFMLNEPRRIALDIAGARAGGEALESDGIVARARQGQYDPATARLVFDLAQPAVLSRAAFAQDGRSLTLSLRQVDAVRFASATRAGRRTFLPPIALSAIPPRGGDRGSITIPLDPPRPLNTRTPRVYGARGSNRPLVVIDPGHGGHDPGAISVLDGRHEKDVTLATAKAVRDELVRSGRVRVALTREDDRFLALPERVAVARRLKADLFVSIHADSAGNPEARGATVYTLSEVASDKEAARLAAKENKADIINGVDLGVENADVRSILIDLAQRETMNVSSAFAALVQRETSSLVEFRSDFHRFANFRVLKAPDTPSVLFEIGYLTNMDDARRLFSGEGQKNVAVGLRRAIETHFARRIADR
jgi:N-acetylmuramoyl-L-alanine amidase